MNKIFNSLREEENNQIKSNRLFLLFVMLLSVVLLGVALFSNYVLLRVKVVGSSMEDTLLNGDILYVYCWDNPEFQDIIIIKDEKQNEWLIKRLIGLPGDTIIIKNGNVYRNSEDTPLVEDYVKGNTSTNAAEASKTWVLKEDEYFYLGDNRNHSQDSRSSYSTCSRSQIVGVVTSWSIPRTA